MAEADGPVRRRVRRLLHAPPLALLLGLGLAPLFILSPRLPGGSGHDPTLAPVALWLGTALLGGLAGTVEGAARPLYRAGALILAASLLSIPAMRLVLRASLPFPHGLATWLGLDGEFAMEADLYEIWLLAWLACLGLVALAWKGVARLRATTGPTSRRREPAR
ncbi:MAG: hypothetical protein PGN34_20745 [Methylobacterium frigidaeris]